MHLKIKLLWRLNKNKRTGIINAYGKGKMIMDISNNSQKINELLILYFCINILKLIFFIQFRKEK